MQKLTLVLLLLLGTSVYSQKTFSISGRVIDNQNESISVGDVLLFPMANDTFVKYASVYDGKFLMESIPEGKYRLQITCLGFEMVEQSLVLDRDIDLEVQLSESATNLDEVEVIAVKPIITNENGNLKIDVTNPVFSAIPDPMELLSKLPNLQVSPDRESVSVMGKGTPLVYMGNQRISLEEFQGLSVDAIGTIEIVRNPSAKYEADGRAVLLITRKVSDMEGVKLNLSETISFKRNYNNYNSINGSFNKNKLTLRANFAYNDLQLWESHQFEFGIPEADIFSDYLVVTNEGNREQINIGGGLFYQINDSDYFSANITARLQPDDYFIDTDTFLKQGNTEDEIITRTDNENTKDFISGNINYNNKLNASTNLFTGVQYSSFTQRLHTDISNNYNVTAFVRSEDRQQKYRIDVLTGRFDFEKTFKNNMKWELGANISNAKANALTNTEFFESNVNAAIDYDYSEKNFASYSQVSGNITKNINFNAGFRIENNVVKGEVETDATPLVNRENTKLFPKAMLNIEIDSSKSLTFNYAKNIKRPNYSKASSISVFINPFLEGEGNVNLLPMLTEELSANFQFKKNSISLEYAHRKNPAYYTIGYEDGAESAIFSLTNLEEEHEFYLNLTFPITKGIWSATNSVSLAVLKIEDVSAVATPVKPYLYLYTDQQFKIAKNTTISFGGWALTKHSEGILERNGLIVLNAAITRTFFDKLHCALRFNDITRAMNFKEKYSINGVNADGVYFADAREIAFSMKYTFGKTKDPNYKNKDVDENLDRIR